MTAAGPLGTAADARTPLLEVRGLGKSYGSVRALSGVTASIGAGEVLCVLGDNGAGKSTLIKVLAGAHGHTEGTLLAHGVEQHFGSPRDALSLGIATVYQDLALVPLLPVWRNFFLGAEETVGRGPFRRLAVAAMRATTRDSLATLGITLRDVDQPIGTLSGGERQAVAIARAVHFGAKLVILDEPTSALGVTQAGLVLRYIARARDRGIGIVFITHNPNHAWAVGDRFLVLRHGTSLGEFPRDAITLEALTGLMAGGEELDALGPELGRAASAGDPL
ncbi:ATP-binding cassette domain-containing protein [Cryobacterium sp. GrIS_2_6]|uniref:ATP-binding cassette domain-containing protein n=1 Tax=Cryobacterium sp. GrIS_2_6 TaxID=3162785 RepID=UPI002E05195D|nr:ATP-binding cassette domain-containing protein [Cryobacterium psychrotolerans]MEC5148411.1 simple sugar transport system ATP-binding protein [Cryobacterium psychrotolerans]